MFSQTVEYALRAVVWLAYNHPESLTTQEIARSTQVPAGYLSKVLQGLARAGLVQAQRGLHGGFSLALSPDELSILDVVNAVDPLRRISRCPLGLATHAKRLCPLHKRLDDSMAMIEKTLSESKIAELLNVPAAATPLCDAPPVPRRAPLTVTARRKR
ncbi:MAG: Rrf2 family transcriptional regulator [Planctomycetes bacterium]|nr:Rrf2 family transcriptional regulator [Planctomycetota bacterium]